MSKDLCPCGTSTPFDSCCGPYLAGKKPAPTAEALMRSRYSAYVKGDIDYISKTHDPKTIGSFDAEVARAWAEKSDWKGLEIKNTKAGGPHDDQGQVEFVAHYHVEGQDHAHHELSDFRREGDQWLFVDGRTVMTPHTRTGTKIGRNDPCHCGSGIKFKKCCAA